MKDNAAAAVLGCFIADALALGPHWEYDQDRLKQDFGQPEQFSAPRPGTYHAGKQAGEFTHYGDQAFILLRSVSGSNRFAMQDFFNRWRQLFDDYSGYIDGATRQTLQRIDFGEGPETSGSNSNDLAGASRIAPLLAALSDDPPAFIQAAKQQTAMTHNNPQVVEAAEFFARTLITILNDEEPIAAMREAADANYQSAPIRDWMEKGIESRERNTSEVVAQFGPTCHIDEAFPCVVHSIAKYPSDPQTALIECVTAGGDSAARGMLVGAVTAAHAGKESLPQEWIDGLAHKDEILKALAI